MPQFDLSAESAAFLDDIVQSGVYATPAAAVEDALGLLQRQHDLRQKLLHGMASARVPGDVAFAELREYAAQFA